MNIQWLFYPQFVSKFSLLEDDDCKFDIFFIFKPNILFRKSCIGYLNLSKESNAVCFNCHYFRFTKSGCSSSCLMRCFVWMKKHSSQNVVECQRICFRTRRWFLLLNYLTDDDFASCVASLNNKLVFVHRKCAKSFLKQCRIRKNFRGQYSCFRGKERMGSCLV